MASLEEALTARLVADSAVSALVSSRVKPQRAGQGDPLPRVLYVRAATDRAQTLGGPAGVAHPMLEMHCWSTRESEARAVADAVRASLCPPAGLVGDVNGCTLMSCRCVDQKDEYVAPQNSGDVALYVTILTFSIWYRE